MAVKNKIDDTLIDPEDMVDVEETTIADMTHDEIDAFVINIGKFMKKEVVDGN